LKIGIIGCGAIGSLFAAHLAGLDDVETWVYDVSQAHVDAINANGLRLTGVGEVHGSPTATTDPGGLPALDFGIVATKGMHTRAAMEATAHSFGGGADWQRRDRFRICRGRDQGYDVSGRSIG